MSADGDRPIHVRAESVEHPWPVIPGIGRRERTRSLATVTAEAISTAHESRVAAIEKEKADRRTVIGKLAADYQEVRAELGMPPATDEQVLAHVAAHMADRKWCRRELPRKSVPIAKGDGPQRRRRPVMDIRGEIFEDRRLRGTPIALAGVLLSMAGKAPSVQVPMIRLAERLGVTERCIRTSQAKLKKYAGLGIVRNREGSLNDFNVYLVNALRPWSEDHPAPPAPPTNGGAPRKPRRQRQKRRTRTGVEATSPALSAPESSAVFCAPEEIHESAHLSRIDKNQSSPPSPPEGDSEQRALNAPAACSCGEPRLPDDMPITPIRAARLESCARAPPEQARAPPAKAAAEQRSAKTVPKREAIGAL